MDHTVGEDGLTHWGWNKMAAILQTTFQMHFLEWKCLHFMLNFNEICSFGIIDNIAALVQLMAYRLSGYKPLPEPMLT